MTPTERLSKEILAMRYFLLGKGYHVALAALEFGRQFHTGVRKDGLTPEYAHQLFLAGYLRTLLPGLMHPEETLAATFLHDVCEDYDVGFDEIRSRFGPVVGEAVQLMTKKYRGVKLPYETYFAGMASNPIAGLAKGSDRAHNILTMSAAGWTDEKKSKYLEEVFQWFLPMLKEGRRKFPQQEPAYENVKTLLLVQGAHVRLALEQSALLKNEQGLPMP